MAKEKDKRGYYKPKTIRLSDNNWNFLRKIKKEKELSWNKLISLIIQKFKNEKRD